MMDKLKNFAIIAFLVFVCYVTSASAIECYSCPDEISCQRTTLYNATKTCTNGCATIFSGFLPIKKSCVSDLTTAEAEQCNDSSNLACYKCTTDRCNNLGRVDHKCVECSSEDVSSNCLQDPTSLPQIRCAAPTVDQACFVSSVGNKMTRGCITTARQVESCVENGSECSTCTVNAMLPCNMYPVPSDRRKCVHCSGTNCNSVSSASLYCAHPDDSCVSINNFGNQIQGCTTDLTTNNANFCKNHKHSCTTCNTDDCNSAVPKSPEDYNVCYSCEGISCQRSTLYTQTTDCEKSDTCVTLFENYTPIKKSCYADLTSAEKAECDTTNNPLCYKCAGNRCNNLGRVDHQCVTCSTSTNSNCLQNPNSVQATRCPAPISDDAYCFVRSAGDSTSRGCLNTPSEISTCSNNNQLCSLCAVNGSSTCNTFEFPAGRRRCHNMRGVIDASSLSTTPSKYCSRAGDSCMIIKSNGKLAQICSSEMNSTEVRFCDSNLQCCSTCLSNNCNTQIPQDSCATINNGGSSSGKNFNHPLFITIVAVLGISVIFMSFQRCFFH